MPANRSSINKEIIVKPLTKNEIRQLTQEDVEGVAGGGGGWSSGGGGYSGSWSSGGGGYSGAGGYSTWEDTSTEVVVTLHTESSYAEDALNAVMGYIGEYVFDETVASLVSGGIIGAEAGSALGPVGAAFGFLVGLAAVGLYELSFQKG